MSRDDDPHIMRTKNTTIFGRYTSASNRRRLCQRARGIIGQYGASVVPFIHMCYGPLYPVDIPPLPGQSCSWLFRSADGPNILASYVDQYPLPITDECFTLTDPTTLPPQQARRILRSLATGSGPLEDWEIAGVALAHIEISRLSDEEAGERIKRGWNRSFFDLAPTLETWKQLLPGGRETLDAVARGNYEWLYVKGTFHYEIMGEPKSITHWWPLSEPFWIFARRFSREEEARQHLAHASLTYQGHGCYSDQANLTYSLKDSYPAWSKIRKRSVRAK